MNMVGVLEYLNDQWGTEDPERIAKQISEGRRLPTEAFASGKNSDYRARVIQAGGIDHILAFLLKTDQPFNEVKNGGDLPCPSIWLNLLNNFCQDGFLRPETLARKVKYKIVINMGPLFQDMSNFEKRELFGARDHWIKSLDFFTNIVSGLLNSDYEKVGDFLVRKGALKSFLVRVLFLEIGDPVICKEIKDFSMNRETRSPKPDIIGMAQSYCSFSIKSLLLKRGGQNIEDFAVTPIRPENKLTLKTGIIQVLETNERPGWYQGGYSSTLNIFIVLYDYYARLSSEFKIDSASSKIVGICRKHLDKFGHLTRDRFFLENVMTGIVTISLTVMTPAINQRQAPIDYNVASAINSGLFDFCLDVCDSNDMRLTQTLEGFLKLILSTVRLPATQKALKKQADFIRCRLERILARLPYLYTGMEIINLILKQVGKEEEPSIDNTCEFCFEKCSKGTTTKCRFCRSVQYCSRDCQRLNWMLHQTKCLEVRETPLPKSLDQIVTDGKIIVSKNITQILLQASLKNVSILNVLIIVDMNENTPLLQTLNLKQFSDVYIQDEEAIESARIIIEKNRADGSLSVIFIGFTEDGLGAPLLTFPESTVPFLPGLKDDIEDGKKWEGAQQFVTENRGIQKIQSHPRLLRAAILKTMKP
jgi:hypothetical protein